MCFQHIVLILFSNFLNLCSFPPLESRVTEGSVVVREGGGEQQVEKTVQKCVHPFPSQVWYQNSKGQEAPLEDKGAWCSKLHDTYHHTQRQGKVQHSYEGQDSS